MLVEVLVAAGLITVVMFPLMETTRIALASSGIVKSRIAEQDLNDIIIKSLSGVGCKKNFNESDPSGSLEHLKFYKDDTDTGKTLFSNGNLFNNSLRIVDMVFDTSEHKFITYFKLDRASMYQTKNDQPCDQSNTDGCYSIEKTVTYNSGSCTFRGNSATREITKDEDEDEDENCLAAEIANCNLEQTNNNETFSTSCYQGGCSYRCNSGKWETVSNTCGCAGVEIDHCLLGSEWHTFGRLGSCQAPYSSGECRYNCFNGIWDKVRNTCSTTPPQSCNTHTTGGCKRSSKSHGGSSGSCISGYTGSCSYTCNDGSWSGSNNCNRTVTYSSCNTHTRTGCKRSSKSHGGSSGSCISGYTGSCSYTCNNGSWGSPSSNNCNRTVTYRSCDTHTTGGCKRSGRSHGRSSGSCISGYTGSCSYTCNNGSWRSPSSNNCVAPPPPPPPPPVNQGCSSKTNYLTAAIYCKVSSGVHSQLVGGTCGSDSSAHIMKGSCSYQCLNGSWSRNSGGGQCCRRTRHPKTGKLRCSYY